MARSGRTEFCLSATCGVIIDMTSPDNEAVRIPGKGYCCSERCELSYRDQQEPWRRFQDTNFLEILDGAATAPWQAAQNAI